MHQRVALRFWACLGTGCLLALNGCSELGITPVPDQQASPEVTEQDPANAGAAPSSESLPPDPTSSLTTSNPQQNLTPQEILERFRATPSGQLTDKDLIAVAAHPDQAASVLELNLNSARITSDGLRALKPFANLRKLDLTGCSLLGDDWKPLSDLTQLEWLSLQGAGLTDASLPVLATLTRLQHLNLANTQITDGPFEYLTGLTLLQELNISGCQLSGACMEAFGPKGAKASLRTVMANNTKFGFFGFDHLKSQRDLEILFAANCDAGDVVIQNLKGLNKLQVLHLSGNSLSDEGLKVLTGMKQLTKLSVNDSRAVSNTTLQRLKSLRQLSELDVSGTGCTVEGIQAFRKLVPDCQVTFGGTTY